MRSPKTFMVSKIPRSRSNHLRTNNWTDKARPGKYVGVWIMQAFLSKLNRGRADIAWVVTDIGVCRSPKMLTGAQTTSAHSVCVCDMNVFSTCSRRK